MIIGYGMVVFCDLFGIWFFVLGKCVVDGKIEYMFVFESVVLDIVGFEFECDVKLGEVIYIIFDGEFYL